MAGPSVTTCLTSTIDVADDGALPTEFRIFAPGVNETSKGKFIFDSESAASVLKAYALGEIDLMIDLNHDSLDENAETRREDARDARGWFKLALRPDGSLWAVDVRWTPDGADRLRQKKQRYISPAFAESKHLGLEDDGRPRELVNVAICAMPATYNAPALVAAARLTVASMQEKSTAVQAALRQKYPDDANGCNNVYVCDLYDATAVFEKEGLYYQIGYTYAQGVATITGDPLQVVRTYAPAQKSNALTSAKRKACQDVTSALVKASKTKVQKAKHGS